jgi:hypothetical protein
MSVGGLQRFVVDADHGKVRAAGGQDLQVDLLGQPLDPRGAFHALAEHRLAQLVHLAGLQRQVGVAAQDGELHLQAAEQPPARRRAGPQDVLWHVHGHVVVLGGQPQYQPALDRGKQRRRDGVGAVPGDNEVDAQADGRRSPAAGRCPRGPESLLYSYASRKADMPSTSTKIRFSSGRFASLRYSPMVDARTSANSGLHGRPRGH